MMDLSYILNVLGEDRENYFHAVAPPIIQTSNFAFPSVEEFRNAMDNELESHLYSRGNNPTVEILRKKMAALEGTEDSLIFSSGVAAITSAVMSVVKAGDHIICVDSPYSWTKHLLTEILPQYHIQTTFVDGRELKNFDDAIQQNTRLIFLESPNTFWFHLQDLEAVCSLAKCHNIITAIDNSYCTPLYQQAHALGVDLIIHTATKYLSGHSDVIAGVICANNSFIQKIFIHQFMCFGAVPSPHDAWLFLRGLRTFPLRLERSTATTLKVISYLEVHPKIEKIYYPFHPSHEQYTLAQKQMKAACGLFAIQLKTTDIEKVELFCNSLKRFLLAVSWGGYESLVFPACLKKNALYPINYVRLYVGLEDEKELVEDIAQALNLI